MMTLSRKMKSRRISSNVYTILEKIENVNQRNKKQRLQKLKNETLCKRVEQITKMSSKTLKLNRLNNFSDLMN